MSREMENVNGHVMFQNNYGRVYVQVSGNCKVWRSDLKSEEGGWLSTDVFVDIVEQTWHANLKIANLFAPVRYTERGNVIETVQTFVLEHSWVIFRFRFFLLLLCSFLKTF